MNKHNSDINPRKYMEMAISVMNNSIQEPRNDKVSPLVGAVLIKPNGETMTAFRGEIRHGDHAEFTLLERKNRAEVLDGSVLFATLEPCAPGARKSPKLSCAERIVNARIAKVWIGIEDPDPSVDRKGIKYLLDNGIQVEMFDPDLQKKIRIANQQFIDEAEERAKESRRDRRTVSLSTKDNIVSQVELDDLSQSDLKEFISKGELSVDFDSEKFYRILTQLNILKFKNKIYTPTGFGLLIFGIRPQFTFHNALIRATYKTAGKGEQIETIEGSLINQAMGIQNWYKGKIEKWIDRTSVQRKYTYEYPLDVLKETIINAIVHRDYDISGASIYFEINEKSIIIKSPGLPVEPIQLEQIQQFNASSLSRNPHIMYIFGQMEMVEHRGLGFDTIRELPTKYKLPLPIVSFQDPYLVFTFPRNCNELRRLNPISQFNELNDDELIGYDYIQIERTVTRKQYEDIFNYDKKKAERHLTHMTELNLIERLGSGPSTRYQLSRQ
ncbi:MAG: hypothetical protein PF518_06110 [Spirochaetaceae bacterium]|jgi:ATP-dependent DNA helicase RecG|nr:hypothetical protein [Spirochaetaceae bacterium]